jgi:hypothetical protein
MVIAMATCINLPKKTEFSLNYCTLEIPNYIYTELSQLESQSLPKEKRQQQLFFLFEYANRQAFNAKNQGQYEIWQNWKRIVSLIDLACESVEQELEDDFYLVY